MSTINSNNNNNNNNNNNKVFLCLRTINPDYGAYPTGCIFKINDGDRRKQFELAKKRYMFE